LLVTIAATSTAALVVIESKRREAEEQRLAAVGARDLAGRKTEEALAARALADRNAEVASDQSKLAIDTLYRVVTQVQNRLKGRPGLRELREDLLKDALEGLGRVAKSTETSPLVLRTRAGAFQRMGDIALELGRTEEALERYLQGREIIDSLARVDPDGDAV